MYLHAGCRVGCIEILDIVYLGAGSEIGETNFTHIENECYKVQ